MKTTMKILPLLFGVMLFFTQCEKEAEMNAEAFMNLKNVEVECNFAEQILWAGAGQNNTDNGTNVGTVTATIEGNMLNVVYDVTNGWYGVEYHLWVGNSIGDMPKNAAPGQFPHSGLASYDIDLAALGFEIGDDIFIAAHAVVREGGLKGLESLLPETAKFEIVLDRVNTYLTTTVSYGGILDGVYGSWCIDSGTFITPETVYDALVYSSYALPEDYDEVDYPENFPKVNWIVNFIEVGDYYTYADVQRAIWELLEEEPENIANPPLLFDAVKVAEIIAAANAYYTEFGDFVPGCGQYLVIVLDPVLNVQPVIIWKPIVCGGEETAWAFGGYTFIKEKIARKWGWIFELTYCEDL